MFAQVVAAHGLRVLGGFAITDADVSLSPFKSLLLLGPDDPTFWPLFSASPENLDGKADPIDRWSKRVIGKLAADNDGASFFPFGGPPHHPFYAWAVRSGLAHPSPIRFLVHSDVGLWVSYRGAIAFRHSVDLPEPQPTPCDACETRPCLSTCPVKAFSDNGYDVDACKAHLQEKDTVLCVDDGCAARRACPLSQKAGRLPAQSQLHMKAFLS